MRSKTCALTILLFLSVAVKAIDDTPPVDESLVEAPNFNNSNPSMSLNLNTPSIVFNFYFTSDLQNGIGQNNSISTLGSVNSNVRWKMSYYAYSDLAHTSGSGTIPSRQIGVLIQLTGNHGNNSSGLTKFFVFL